MKSLWKYLGLVGVYALVFIPPALREPGNGAKFAAVFAAVFMAIFLLVLLGGSILIKKILSLLGVRVLSRHGDIVKTDFGHKIGNVFARNAVNIIGDAFFNLIFVLFLIFFAVMSASIAKEAASAM